MEKLTLEHLSPYLPYKLEVKIFDDRIKVMNATNSSSTYWVGIGACVKWSENCKPILRPLSDLTKEIEYNGEKFVPIIEIAKKFYPRYNDFEFVEYDPVEEIIMLQSRIDNSPYFQFAFNVGSKSISHRLVQELLKLHIDIFGLIEKNLAINKNSI
jgi:hypothetical protein